MIGAKRKENFQIKWTEVEKSPSKRMKISFKGLFGFSECLQSISVP